MADDREWKVPVGLTAIIDRLGLKIPYPVVRSEVAAGTRKTIVTNTQILEQYPRVYQRFTEACRAVGCVRMKAITAFGNEGSIRFHAALGWETQEIDDYAGPNRRRIVFTKLI